MIYDLKQDQATFFPFFSCSEILSKYDRSYPRKFCHILVYNGNAYSLCSESIRIARLNKDAGFEDGLYRVFDRKSKSMSIYLTNLDMQNDYIDIEETLKDELSFQKKGEVTFDESVWRSYAEIFSNISPSYSFDARLLKNAPGSYVYGVSTKDHVVLSNDEMTIVITPSQWQLPLF